MVKKQLKGFAYLKKHNPERLKEIVTKGGQSSSRGKAKVKPNAI
jgi:general stress protein YciG